MRCLFVSFVLLASACSQHNPDACCRTQDQCTQFGLDGVTGCDSGKVCNDSGACVASQCTTSADCADPSLPICENNLCIAKCTSDDECLGDTPHCSTGAGVCVGCLADSDCDSTTPICDMTTQSCRTCAADSECASGACLAATTGTCADPANVMWVDGTGHDTGTCPKTAPCKTITYAVSQILSFRNVIHVDGAGVSTGSGTLVIAGPVYIDGGTGTTLSRPGATVFSLMNSADLTLDGITIPGGVGEVAVISAGKLRLRNANLTLSTNGTTPVDTIKMTGGSLVVDHSTFDSGVNGSPPAIECTAGTVEYRNATFRAFDVAHDHCDVTVDASTFNTAALTFSATNGKVIIENSVFTSANADADAVSVSSLTTGSRIRFNSWVDTSSSALGGVGLQCDSTVDVSSNIFVWGPQALAGSDCSVRYSIFDDPTSVPPALHNTVASPASLFVNLANGDFHLSSTSPARGASDPAETIATDHDGKPRPNPAGTPADTGAYEAP